MSGARMNLPTAILLASLILAAAIAWQRPGDLTAHASGRIAYQTAAGGAIRACWTEVERPALDVSGLVPMDGGPVPKPAIVMRCSEWR